MIKTRKIDTLAIGIIALIGLLFGTIVIPSTSTGETASSAVVLGSHYGWAGYNGNNTIYLSTAIPSTNPYYLPQISSYQVQPASSNVANEGNGIVLVFGSKVSEPAGLVPTGEFDYGSELYVVYGVTIATGTNQYSWYDKTSQAAQVTGTVEQQIYFQVEGSGFSSVDGFNDPNTYSALINDSPIQSYAGDSSTAVQLLLAAISLVPHISYATIPIGIATSLVCESISTFIRY